MDDIVNSYLVILSDTTVYIKKIYILIDHLFSDGLELELKLVYTLSVNVSCIKKSSKIITNNSL